MILFRTKSSHSCQATPKALSTTWRANAASAKPASISNQKYFQHNGDKVRWLWIMMQSLQNLRWTNRLQFLQKRSFTQQGRHVASPNPFKFEQLSDSWRRFRAGSQSAASRPETRTPVFYCVALNILIHPPIKLAQSQSILSIRSLSGLLQQNLILRRTSSILHPRQTPRHSLTSLAASHPHPSMTSRRK